MALTAVRPLRFLRRVRRRLSPEQADRLAAPARDPVEELPLPHDLPQRQQGAPVQVQDLLTRVPAAEDQHGHQVRVDVAAQRH